MVVVNSAILGVFARTLTMVIRPRGQSQYNMVVMVVMLSWLSCCHANAAKDNTSSDSDSLGIVTQA